MLASTMTDTKPKRPRSSVAKALDLLLLFRDHNEVGVLEAGRHLGVDKSTASRLLTTLRTAGFTELDSHTRRYRIGHAVLQLAGVHQQGLDLRQLALPVMKGLRDLSGETVNLQIRTGDTRTCIELIPSLHDIRWVGEVGVPLPLNLGSSAKVLLAWLPEAELDALLEHIFRARANQPRRSRKALAAQLAQVRNNGYAVSMGERVAGVSSLAVPVRGRLGQVVAAMAVTGPSSRWTRRHMMSFRHELITAGHKLSEAIGFTGNR